VAKIRILSDIFTIFASWTKKAKAIKRTIRIIWLTIVSTAVIIFAGAITIQFPQVQTIVASQVVNILSDKLDGDISFEKIHLRPFTTLVLKNAVITDRNPYVNPDDSTCTAVDTFFRAEYIIARFSLESLLDHEGLHLDKAFIRNAQMNLVLEDKEGIPGADTTYKDNLSRLFRLKSSGEKVEYSEKELFHIRKVEIRNMGFAMKNHGFKRLEYHGGINWDDLDIRNINLDVRELQFKNGIMSGNADWLSFREKSGFDVKEMSGKARVGRGRTIIEDLHIKDSWSDLYLNLYQMSYTGIKAFSNFIDEVRIDGDIQDRSILDIRTITYFAPELGDNCLKAAISGKLEGYVSDFSMENLKVTSHGGTFSALVNGQMRGLPDIGNTVLNTDVQNLYFTFDGLGRFVSEWIPDGELDMSSIARGMIFTGNAKTSGLLNNMHAKLALSSMIGSAEADVRFSDMIIQARPMGIAGKVGTDRLDIGRIVNSDLIGKTSLRTTLSTQLGNKEGISLNLDSLHVESMVLNGYEYKNIAARGQMDKDAINGTLISQDPNCNFLLQGGYARSAKTNNAVYRIAANIGHADLNMMNIDKRGKSVVSMRANMDFTHTSTNDIVGKVSIGDIRLENDEGRYDVGNLILESHSTGKEYRIHLDSEFADCSYSGTASIIDFVKDLRDITLKKELPSLFKDPGYTWKGNSYDLDFMCHEPQDLLSFAVPGMYIESGTSLNISVRDNGRFDAILDSKRIAFKKHYMKGFKATFDNAESTFNGRFTCDEFKVATLKMSDNSFRVYADDDHIGLGYSYDNHSELENRGEFIMNGTLSRVDDKVNLGIDIKPSSVYMNSKEWNILPSEIHLTAKDLYVKTFGLTSGEQAISMNGRASADRRDTLTLGLERFDISVVNSVLPSDMGIRGAATGTFRLTSPMDDKGILVDLICDSTYVANVPLGILSIGTRWDEEGKYFDMFARNMIGSSNSIDLTGLLYPDTGKLSASAVLNRFNISYAQPFLKDIFSEIGGYASGKIVLEGPLDRLAVRSEGTRLDEAVLRVDYTDVPYYVDGPFHVNEMGVYFDDMTVRDRFNGTGTLYGSINYDYFSNIVFDTRIKVDQIEAVNISEEKADAFYGNLFGTGNISFTGPVNSLVLTVDALTAKAGQLHIPLSASATAGTDTGILKFKEIEKEVFIDPYEVFVQDSDRKLEKESDFSVRIRVNASPEVEAFVEIDKSSGNVLSGRGSGLIELDINKDLFNINGDYTLNSGNYKFVAMGLVSRDFLIQDGSSIRFNGDIMESTLDIDATYKTKASIATLISDTTSVANRRTVECSIGITDKLSNPRLQFGIQIPDLDPMVKSRVESALSTEDKIQKQFLSLIISNNFLPDEQSGIVNNSSLLYSNVTEVMANQLNNIFQKLDIPLDLGLNYQPNERGNDVFDVDVSTQLFNNRVVVNGSVGNKQYSSGNTQNEVVGDLDIEIKLSKSGSLRLNLFSHSADQYTNYLDNSQRNGVGLMYQTEFNNLGQFFRNIFSKKSREESRIAEEQAIIEGGKTRIVIESPKKQ